MFVTNIARLLSRFSQRVFQHAIHSHRTGSELDRSTGIVVHVRILVGVLVVVTVVLRAHVFMSDLRPENPSGPPEQRYLSVRRTFVTFGRRVRAPGADEHRSESTSAADGPRRTSVGRASRNERDASQRRPRRRGPSTSDERCDRVEHVLRG